MKPGAILLVASFIFIPTNAESTEEQHYTYTNFYAPSTVNFHEIYSNSLALLSEEPTLTTSAKEDEFHISNIPSQYVEFHPQAQRVTTLAPTSAKSSTGLDSKEDASQPPRTTSTTTKRVEESSVKVIPITLQRGVLDLLFPATRVRTFKSVFDSVRRLLSYTFRK